MLANKLMSAALSSGAGDKLYVDDVFSAYTYTGNGSTQTINNGIDLAGKGGLVWCKQRSEMQNHVLFDSARGASSILSTDVTAPQGTGYPFSLTSTGFSLGSYASLPNSPGGTYASWTFRKAPKFFDVVTYTGNGTTQNIAHSLGSTPGCIIVKNTTSSVAWSVWHRSVNGGAAYGILNTTDAFFTDAAGAAVVWGNNSSYVAPIATQFTVGSNNRVNTSGDTYVAYLFAHDPSADGIIQCGSFTTDGSSNATVNLGWEPQFLLHKQTNALSPWYMTDQMRGWSMSQGQLLQANLPDAEGDFWGGYLVPTATGFEDRGAIGANRTYIYLAIRRPNKPPTSGTQVYNAIARTGTGAAATVTGVGFAPDLFITSGRAASDHELLDRLRGNAIQVTNGTSADQTVTAQFGTDVFSTSMDGVRIQAAGFNTNGALYINHFFRRAPGVFSTLCYTGTGSNKTEVHDLTKAPSLMLVKSRSSANDWNVWCDGLLGTEKLVLNSTAAKVTDATAWNSTAPTSSVISLGTAAGTNTNAATYVAYLFSNLAGIQSIGTYIGDGNSGRLINCGFTTGSRYVCIKAISTTGVWLVADSTRGITSGNDPYLALNSTAAEVTTEDWLDPHLSGFLVNQTPASNANVNGVTYMYWSIA